MICYGLIVPDLVSALLKEFPFEVVREPYPHLFTTEVIVSVFVPREFRPGIDCQRFVHNM